MTREIKYFDLELIEDVLTKITHVEYQFNLMVFDYRNYSKIKKIENEEFLNGIYFLTERSNSNKLYVGQTTNGINRFNNHSFFTNEDKKKCKVFFFEINYERGNINVLNYIEKFMIEDLRDKSNLKNKQKGNNSSISSKDEKFASHAVKAIRDFMKLFDFELVNSKKSDEDIIYNSLESSFTRKSKGDVINSVIKFAKERNGWITKKEIFEEMSKEYAEDLENKRWASEYGLHQVISRDLQKRTEGYKNTIKSQLIFEAKRNEKGEVVAIKLI